MTSPVVTIDAEAEIHQTFALFRTNGIRRLAVIRQQQFVGMITIDDLLVNLAADLSDLARPVIAEVQFGHHEVPLPVKK